MDRLTLLIRRVIAALTHYLSILAIHPIGQRLLYMFVQHVADLMLFSLQTLRQTLHTHVFPASIFFPIFFPALLSTLPHIVLLCLIAAFPLPPPPLMLVVAAAVDSLVLQQQRQLAHMARGDRVVVWMGMVIEGMMVIRGLVVPDELWDAFWARVEGWVFAL